MALQCLDWPDKVYAKLIKDNRSGPFDIGSTVKFECNDGYQNGKQLQLLFTCTLENGAAHWIGPECTPVSCGHPGPIDNATLIGSVFSFPSSVEYKCNEGYKPKGKGRLFCMPSGQWSSLFEKFSCVPITCPELEDPVNGMVNYDDITRRCHSTATYICDKNFRLVGNPTRSCTESGEWSGYKPFCVEITCPTPDSQFIKDPRYSYPPGAVILFCTDLKAKDYKISLCKENGQWTTLPPMPKPLLLKITCPAPDPKYNMTPKGLYHPSDYIIFRHPQTNVSVLSKCMENGQWSESPPMQQTEAETNSVSIPQTPPEPKLVSIPQTPPEPKLVSLPKPPTEPKSVSIPQTQPNVNKNTNTRHEDKITKSDVNLEDKSNTKIDNNIYEKGKENTSKINIFNYKYVSYFPYVFMIIILIIMGFGIFYKNKKNIET